MPRITVGTENDAAIVTQPARASGDLPVVRLGYGAPGTSTVAHLEENLAAALIELTPDQVEQLDTAI